MKKTLFAILLGVLSLGLTIGDAEAKRFGGGKSSGMQRDSVTQRQASTPPAAAPQQNAAAPAAAPQAGAPAAAPKRNWLGPIAGLAAGLGIAALLSHFGLGAGMANFLMIALLVFAAFFVFRLLFRRNQGAAPAAQGLQYAGAPAAAQPLPASAPPEFAQSAASPAAPTARNIPEGFDSEGFVRIAKLNFVRLQAANDAKNLDDLREFVSPEMFAEIKLQMDERGDAAQQTDVVTLNGELLEVVSDGNRHIASVRFSGMIREEAGGAAHPFDEVWNLAKPLDGSKGWVVAGIQQLS